ncbi:MAG TPA: hypothetical protein VG273_00485 [Bryobacteraceae bacterium]|jgi:hypothetical protein|nr:hypothetical protein [Bryobacteraceae bacterium]
MRKYISRIFPVTLPLAAVLLAGFNATPAFSQRYESPYDSPYGDRDRARQDRALFDRARMDLDRASNYPYASRADRKRFDEARRELFDFASRFDQGRYERHELDEAIDRINRVVRENSLDPRDRGALEDDLRRMRDYREFRSHLR